MKSMKQSRQRGQGMTEYIIIVALIAVAAIGIYQFFGQTIRNQTAGIANEVANAEDGALSVSFSVKLTLTGLRVAGVGKIGYSRKFSDESEFITPDPNQPTLTGVEGGAS